MADQGSVRVAPIRLTGVGAQVAGFKIGMIGVLALGLAGCVTTAPDRNFRDSYAKVWSKDVEGTPGGPYVVYDLDKERRLMVRRSFGAGLREAFSLGSMIGVSDGQTSVDEASSAAQTYLHQAGRGTCELYDPGKEPGRGVYEFRYRC